MPDVLDDQLLSERRINQSIGMNDKDEPDSIGEQRVALLQNLTVTRAGLIKTRGGATLVADDKGNAFVQGLGTFRKEGSTAEQHMVSNGVWYKRNAGDSTWTTVKSGLNTLATVFFLQANNIFLMSNGTDNVHTWDGSTATDEGDTNTDPPKFHFAIYHKNRVLAGRNDESIVYYSDALDPQTWDRATNAIKPGSGEGSTGIALIEQSISAVPGFAYLKNDRSFYINSNDSTPGNWPIAVLDLAHGCVATRTAVFLGSSSLVGGVAYLSKEGSEAGDNVYRVRTLVRTRNDALSPGPIISRDIEGDTLSDLTEAQESRCAAIFFNNKYILSIPSGASSINDTVCVLDLNVSRPEEGDYKWSVFKGWNAAVFNIFEESNITSLYFGNDAADSIVLKAFNGTTDNGVAITSKITGRAENFTFPENLKTGLFVEVYFKGTDGSQATVRILFDDGTSLTLGTVTLQSAGPTLPQTLPFDLSASNRVYSKFANFDTQVSRTFQVEIEHSSGTEGNTMEYLGYVIAAHAENVSIGETL